MIIILRLLFCLLIASSSFVNGTITVLDTGHKFASKQDHIYGKRLWKGYEYYARLQYIPENIQLCPNNNRRNDDEPIANRTIVVPTDGIPVALLVRGGGGCTITDKAKYVMNHIQPNGLVRYLIMDSAQRERTKGFINTDHDDYYEGEDAIEDWDQVITVEEITSTISSAAIVTEDSFVSSIGGGIGDYINEDDEHLEFDVEVADDVIEKSQRKYDSDKHVDLPFFILHVSFSTEYQLLDLLFHQDDDTRDAGGPRITIDSRLGTGKFPGSNAAVWIAVCAMMSACACSFLLVVNGSWDEPDNTQNNNTHQRPTRRRLTREQVRQLFPVFRFDGEELHLIPRHNHTQQQQQSSEENTRHENDDGEALITSTTEQQQQEEEQPIMPSRLPTVAELDCCSICLDDYEAGDKMRILPCNHAFHSRCVGKWLSERSAVCPLCKEDLFIEEEEEESDDEGGPMELLQPPEGIAQDSFLSQLYQFLTVTARDEPEVTENNGNDNTNADAADVENPPVNADEQQAAAIDDTLSADDSSWWRNMFHRIRRHRQQSSSAEVETTEMLTEPLLPAVEEEQQQQPTQSGEETIVVTPDNTENNNNNNINNEESLDQAQTTTTTTTTMENNNNNNESNNDEVDTTAASTNIPEPSESQTRQATV